ncbi:VWA domain-containing protein [Cytophagaceae bacterium DM2B3-1]|uniref:VWA domain-containing protein n=2 Tax=Xanthocytophaga TaxID=3078918 RepID=A0ABT7CHT6_9BACT|nr:MULTISPECIES: VWA domain-containing protein [Xanthocytophaga]MDJ1468367.1 VWA domain-containing protein [Xanthocytophaga flavus]MDJ1493253.1 VWA domain-containing protein [Xanthocytophaga flavus]MDJ1504643.1 VWA domain-containing protein [Xanthocytophaga agilis]
MQQHEETLKRWRLMLGGEDADGTGAQLEGELAQMDAALGALYEFERKGKFQYGEKSKQGGSEGSNPSVARWLGDIRKYFPQSVVQVMQNDALKNESLKQKMMLEPEILEQANPDVHLVATLMELGKLIPSKTKDTARRVVQKVVDELLEKLAQNTIQAIQGAINRSVKNRRPRYNEIDWNTTIRKNLKHYQEDYKTIIPEVRIGYGRKTKKSLRDIVLCIDQSGSMGTSVVYSGIFGAVMASLPSVSTKMVVFDTAVADLTEDLKDPVDLLFGVQLGGGTDINKALGYCQEIITKPNDTILVLITDLYEGGNEQQMRRKIEEIVSSGVQVVCLLALDDQGAPSYDHGNAKFLATHEVPVFACTPDMFPDLMAAAISKQDLNQWAGDRDIVLKGTKGQ